MEITLDKIELVKDRTGVNYKEAKDALEKADGSVVDAIINIEDEINTKEGSSIEEKGTDLVDFIKGIIEKGNVTRIVVKNRKGANILNIPVNVGIIGVACAPTLSVVSAVAAFGFKCEIEILKTDGTIIKVSEKANETYEKAAKKGTEAYEELMNNEKVEKALEKAGTVLEEAKTTGENILEKTTNTVKTKLVKNKEENIVVEDKSDNKEKNKEENKLEEETLGIDDLDFEKILSEEDDEKVPF